MNTKELLSRVDHLLNSGTAIAETKWVDLYNGNRVDYGRFSSFRSAALSFIDSLFGGASVYFKEFDKVVKDNHLPYLQAGVEILKSIRHEIECGWLDSYKSLVAAEIFTEFLEMSEHLLEEGYGDAAAVMIGSVLEEHLRHLCNNHKVDTFLIRETIEVPKKADVLNADLKKAGVYGPNEQKQVTAWLGIRNSAAHGKYNEYRIEQVQLMYQSVLDFITRTK